MKLKSLFYTLLASAPLLANAAPNICDLSNIESMSAPQANSCGDIAVHAKDGNSAVKFYCYAYEKDGNAHALSQLMLFTINIDEIYKEAKAEAKNCTKEYRRDL